MKHNNNENAVSPVVSVILMLAIVIILAAVIGAFVFGMAGDQHKGRTLGISTKLYSGDVILTLTSGTNEDLAALESIDVYIGGVKQSEWEPTSVGNTTTYHGSYNKGDKIRLIGHFYPNDEQIILYESTL